MWKRLFKVRRRTQGDVAREVLALATADWYAKLERSERNARCPK